jgi:hypothetical protein
MACFSLGFLEQILIWLVVIGAVIALIKLVLPLALGSLGTAGGVVIQALNIVLWAIVCVAIIIFVFELISCLVGLPAFRR